ncbi:MAG: hypothetical protein WCJ66_15370 [Verrucomicrobiota bacterium]
MSLPAPHTDPDGGGRSTMASGYPSAIIRGLPFTAPAPRAFVIKHTDPRGNTWNYSYDANGNLISALPPGVATGDSFEYNSVGLLTAHVHPADGTGYRQRDTFEYFTSGSSKGLLKAGVCGTDGLGGGGISGAALRTSYTYDAVGNVTGVVDPRGNDTQLVYNQLNQLMQVKSAPGGGGVRTQIDFQYSLAGILRRTHYQDQISGSYDTALEEAFASLASQPLHQNANMEYNLIQDDIDLESMGIESMASAHGRVVRVNQSHFDENGNPIGSGKVSTSYDYDTIGQLTSMTDAVGGVTQFTYDANGQVTHVASPLATSGADAHNAVQFRYDERGLPFQETAALGSASQSTTQYDYDANGNLSRVSEGLEGTPQVTTMESDAFAIKYQNNQGAVFYRVRLGRDYLPRHGIFMSGGGDRAKMQGATMAAAQVHPFGNFNGRSVRMCASLGLIMSGGEDPENMRSPITSDTEMCGNPPSGLFRGRFMSWLSPSTIPKTKLTLLGEPASSSNLATITDPLGNTTTNHFDACGNLVSTTVTGATGATNPATGAAATGVLSSSTATYDSAGRLTNSEISIETTEIAHHSIEFSMVHADNGQTTSITDPLGHSMSYGYDSVGRLSSVTNPKGDSTTYTYDANSNVSGVTKRFKVELGKAADYVLTKSFGYDALNRCTSATDNVGNTESYAYDSLGNPVKTLRSGVFGHYRVDCYEYDNLSRLTRSGTDMDGDGNAFGANDIVTSQSWDANSRLASATDPNGHTTTYSYDSLDRMTQTTLADGSSSHLSYDVHGNPISTTDANGTMIAYTYDGDNRLTRKDITPAVGVASSTTFEQFSYDGLGRVVQATNNAGTTSFTYDSLGDVLTETQNGLTVTNTYDAAGNRLTVTYPGGRQLAYTYEGPCNSDLQLVPGTCTSPCKYGPIIYSAYESYVQTGDRHSFCKVPYWRAAYLVSTVTLQQSTDGETPGLLVTHHYIGDQLERTDLANGTQTLYSYNGGVGTTNATGDSGWGQIRRIQHLVSNGSSLEDITYSYDAEQNRTGESTSFAGVTTSRLYQYDAADRLTHTLVTANGMQTRNTTYTLDKAGNRISVSGDAHPGSYTLDATTPEPADAQVNQYTTTPVGGFTYEKNGNRIAETSGATTLRTFSYDYANRLVAVNNGSTGAPIADYGYDALGRRILKATPSGATYNTTRYVYDGDGVIEERDANGIVVRAYTETSGSDISGTPFIPANSIVTKKDDSSVGCLRYWPHTDANGSTLALTLDNGAVAERYDYADYGEPAFFDGSGNAITGSAVGNPYLFGGMRYDSESGFHWCVVNNHQMVSESYNYDPRTGIMIQFPCD